MRYFEGNLAEILQGAVEEILIADDAWFWIVNNQSCDCNSVILKINGKMIKIVHDRETIEFTESPSYNAELYCRIIRPSEGERIVFREVLYSEVGMIEGLKFRWNGRYLFIFASEDNLIITKSIIDLHDNITWDEIPDYDDSVLFDR